MHLNAFSLDHSEVDLGKLLFFITNSTAISSLNEVVIMEELIDCDMKCLFFRLTEVFFWNFTVSFIVSCS